VYINAFYVFIPESRSSERASEAALRLGAVGDDVVKQLARKYRAQKATSISFAPVISMRLNLKYIIFWIPNRLGDVLSNDEPAF
jgi:hypothetical protein